jgi:competence protein ComGC
MLCRKSIQKGYTVAEIIIVFAVIALHVVSTLPGLVRIRKHSRTV